MRQAYKSLSFQQNSIWPSFLGILRYRKQRSTAHGGAWVPLALMAPAADIPVLQISLVSLLTWRAACGFCSFGKLGLRKLKT
jgi:hypothetical protein